MIRLQRDSTAFCVISNANLRCFMCYVFLFLPLSSVYAEPPEIVLRQIESNKAQIESAASLFKLNPLYLAAIIYTERTQNYDISDTILDVPLAKAHLNSSLGFCQIKLKTAYYIERQLSDSNSLYYLGKKYENVLPVSQSPHALIEKLLSIPLNIRYAAAYLGMMQKRWKKAGVSIEQRPDILGTLYSTGLYQQSGAERKPHAQPKANRFGLDVSDNIEKTRALFEMRD